MSWEEKIRCLFLISYSMKKFFILFRAELVLLYPAAKNIHTSSSLNARVCTSSLCHVTIVDSIENFQVLVCNDIYIYIYGHCL